MAHRGIEETAFILFQLPSNRMNLSHLATGVRGFIRQIYNFSWRLYLSSEIKPHQEEDFADFLSSKILVNLKKQGQYMTVQNMSCGLGNINKTNPDELTTTNLRENDVHSSQLYRILSVASATDIQTKQCSMYFEKYKPKAAIFKNYCELKD